jgi:hypothetical protein
VDILADVPTDGNVYGYDGATAAWVAALPLAGGTLTGPLTLAATPTASLQAATKAYVDNAVATGGVGASNSMPLMDGVATAGVFTTYSRGDHIHPSDTSLLALAGGTMTGTLTLAANPVNALDAVTKQYSDLNKNVPIAFSYSGKPVAGAKILVPIAVASTIPANFVGSLGLADTAPTASAVFTIYVSHAGGAFTSVGTITFAPGGGGTISTGPAITLAVGDAILIAAPQPSDTTLSDIGITIMTVRT